MEKAFVKYMKYGKEVKSSYTEEEYKIVEDECTNDVLKCVSVRNYDRYNTLKAWKRNKVHEKEPEKYIEDEREKKSYEIELRIADLIPNNFVRFIYSNYKSKFEVRDLTNVIVNGKVKRVVYLDEYHFMFEEDNVCYHICQFAEMCEKNGMTVKPIGA